MGETVRYSRRPTKLRHSDTRWLANSATNATAESGAASINRRNRNGSDVERAVVTARRLEAQREADTAQKSPPGSGISALIQGFGVWYRARKPWRLPGRSRGC